MRISEALDDGPARCRAALSSESVFDSDVFNARGVLIAAVSPDGRIHRWNENCEQLTGYSLPEIRDLAYWDVLLSEDERQRARGSALAMPGRAKLITKRGEPRVIRWSHFPNMISEPPCDLLAGVDVTASLAGGWDAEQDRRFFLESSPLAVVRVDAAGIVLEWSPAAERVFGWTALEVLGCKLPVVPDHAWAELQLFANTGGARRKGWRKDGTEIDVAVWCTPVEDRTGHPVEYVLHYEDLTDRKRLEEEVRQVQKMEAIGMLAGGIAHDFNNLLTAITGYTSLVSAAPVFGEKQREHLRQALEASERATALARQLLTFSRRATPSQTPCDLNDVVSKVTRMLSRLIGDHIEVRLELALRLPPVQVDRVGMDQVLINLALNARDAMPEGGRLTLSTGLETVDAARALAAGLSPGTYVTLQTADTGCGMSDEVRARIFEPFFTTKPDGHGTGLGLSTALAIVRQSKGSIQVASTPGTGTIFTLYLPAIEALGDAGTAKQVTPAVEDSENVDRKRVLLVEDDPGVSAFVMEVLERDNCSVVAVASPADAIDHLRRAPDAFDLVLSDVVLPGMNGVEMVSRLQAVRPDLQAVYMSGYPDRLEQLSDRIPQGAMLAKPFSADSLRSAVKRASAATA